MSTTHLAVCVSTAHLALCVSTAHLAVGVSTTHLAVVLCAGTGAGRHGRREAAGNGDGADAEDDHRPILPASHQNPGQGGGEGCRGQREAPPQVHQVGEHGDVEFYSGHVACNSAFGVRGYEVVDMKFCSGYVACNSAFGVGVQSCRHEVLF